MNTNLLELLFLITIDEQYFFPRVYIIIDFIKINLYIVLHVTDIQKKYMFFFLKNKHDHGLLWRCKIFMQLFLIGHGIMRCR